VATFQTKPTSKRLVETVVVGNATVDDSKFEELSVKLIAVVPVIESHNFCPLVGVPDVVIDVIGVVDCPVITTMSKESVFIAYVLEFEESGLTLGVTRLFVSSCVSVVPTTAPDGAVKDVPQAAPVETAMPAAG
jgi:hypothetical protein